MIYTVGYMKKKFGVSRIVYGDQIVRSGLFSYAKFETSFNSVHDKHLRIDGIKATSPKQIQLLLSKIEEIARHNGCCIVEYVDDTPRDEIIEVFIQAGYSHHYIDDARINCSFKKRVC